MKAEKTDGDTATDRKYVQDWVKFKKKTNLVMITQIKKASFVSGFYATDRTYL